MSAAPLAVLLVTHYFPAHRGGVEIVAGELARRLLETGAITLTWISSDTDAAPQWPGLTCLRMPSWNGLERRFQVPVPIWSPTVLATLWRAVGAADVLHIHDTLYPGNIAAAAIALVRRKPVIVTQHVGYVPYRNRLLRSLVAIGNNTVAACLLMQAQRAVFISAAVKVYFGARCTWKRPPLCVPNGVDVELFRPPTAAERAAARESLTIEPTRTAFLFIGRFFEKKGVPLLQRLASRMPDAMWLFAGSGPIDPTQWQLPNVHVFRDRARQTLRELIWASDLLLLPSETEGFPLVVQESLACGLPALVTSDIAEGYPPSRTVLLCEPLGPAVEERWLARLKQFSSGQDKLPSAAMLASFAREHWAWDKTISAYLELFAQCRSKTIDRAASAGGRRHAEQG